MKTKKSEMTRAQAKLLDNNSVYVDLCADTDCYGIFGTESGFCYELLSSEEEANYILKYRE